jgi:hypothetical protein
MPAGKGWSATPGAYPALSLLFLGSGEKLMRTFISILAGCLFMVSNIALSQDLSRDDQIREALIGNTISGVEGGKPYVEFLQPDGQINGKESEGRYTGSWQIANGRICFRYVDEGKAKNWDCVKVAVTGSRIVWIGRGERSYANLIIGNPNGL